MDNRYQKVLTRFLRNEERLIGSQEQEMPLVIEADEVRDVDFLHEFLKANAEHILEDMARYGAVLLRGFDITTDAQFEQTVLSIPQFKGISDAFMAETGRDRVGDLRYVLHTNSVYKTGGTLYLGGFHTENYYSPDVPAYISFCCLEPSEVGGETGLINTEKVYQHLPDALKKKLEESSFLVGKWLVSEVAERYQISQEQVKEIADFFDFPVIGEGSEQLLLMYKPSVFEHPLTQKKALQINLFELPTLNKELRKRFMNDYQGNSWFWHRLLWKLPSNMFNAIEYVAVLFISLFNSPKRSMNIVQRKIQAFKASKKNRQLIAHENRVGSCFTQEQVQQLAQIMRDNYCSCLWKKGDVLLVDNRKVMHAGMPGVGPRLVRAMICNPISMKYSPTETGLIKALDSNTDSMGSYMVSKTVPQTCSQPSLPSRTNLRV